VWGHSVIEESRVRGKKIFEEMHPMRLQRTQIVALANQKGGCGKTTTAVSLAAGLSYLGYNVCLVDVDSQCNATDSFGVERDDLQREGKFTVADAYLKKKPASEILYDFGERFSGHLSLIPGHRGLGSVSARLEAELHATVTNDNYSELDADDIKNEHRLRLKNSLESLRGHIDVVIIDTPPELGFLMTSSLIAADSYIIPVFPSGYDLKGLETLTRTVDKVQKRFNPKLKLLGVVVGNYDTRAKLDADVLGLLVRKFGKDLVFPMVINRSVRHREATVYGTTIFEHAPGEPAAEQYAALSRELVSRLEATQNAPAQTHVELMEANRRG
jgi:chromosome partitioning protein